MRTNIGETKGIILFTRNYKEKDKLVKIFTESYGKLMFYVKGASRPNNPLAAAILPFSKATFVGDFRGEGLSFLNSYKFLTSYTKIQEDIFISAYATYILGLVDAAIDDRVYDPALFGFVSEALALLNEGQDPEVITAIFEVQMLERFGVRPVWDQCAVGGERSGRFDYSFKYNGVICEKHFALDPHRLHADPRAIYFLRMFSAIRYDQIQSISVKPATKQAIRSVLDQLYDEYVGIHLKSKKFIDDMQKWADVMKRPEQEEG
ncbi:DNA repair protein recO [Enterococcus canis]|uniref:DNA repair protein RecO n=1 Tax=Enterococcus canis TaxID=214095 RepID=A0A1L8RJW5_9ENTE|nr:DNA repair protein RecO [Enterococcus canis]OJG20005.1 DNA repair protein recO [Enterococcus canis]